MNDDTPLPFDLPAVARKKVSAAFDGGDRLESTGLLPPGTARQRWPSGGRNNDKSHVIARSR
jgi:hypothetical protein